MEDKQFHSGSWKEFARQPLNRVLGAFLGSIMALSAYSSHMGCSPTRNCLEDSINAQLVPISQAEKDSLYTHFEGQSSGVINHYFANGDIYRANSVSDLERLGIYDPTTEKLVEDYGEIYTLGDGLFFYFDQDGDPNMFSRHIRN